MINQGGLAATLPYLADLSGRWAASGADRSSPLWREAHELAGHMLLSWPSSAWRDAEPPSNAATMLTLLTGLEDSVRIDALLADVVAIGMIANGDGESIVPALRLLPPSRAGDWKSLLLHKHDSK